MSKSINGESNFKILWCNHTLLNACCHPNCLCNISIQKGKHIIVKISGKWGSECLGISPLGVFCVLCVLLWLLIFVHAYIEGATKILFEHLNPCHERVGWHISYLLIWKCVYTVICYTYFNILDMLFLTTGLPMWNCSYLIYIFFFLSFTPSEFLVLLQMILHMPTLYHFHTLCLS